MDKLTEPPSEVVFFFFFFFFFFFDSGLFVSFVTLVEMLKMAIYIFMFLFIVVQVE